VAVASCVSGGAVAATCSRTAPPGGAAAVSDGLVRSLRSSLSLRFLGLLFFFSVVFGLVLPLFPFLFSVFFFSLPSLSFVLSLPSLSSAFFRFLLLPPVSSPPLQRSSGSIYRAQGVALLWSMGSNRPVGHWA
jgi:hypothetical protein